MIRLDTTSRKLQAVLAGAITTNQLHCVVSYSDHTSTAYNGGTQLTSTNSTTAVDICDAPAASTVRDIDYINIRNRDTAAATVTVMLDSSGADSEIAKAILSVGDQLVYTHGEGWKTLASDGTLKSGTGLGYTPVNKAGDTMTGLLTFAAGADIASAATIDLTAATGNVVRITGTTTVTNVTINNGQVQWCYAVGALPLTHHATNLPLPGSASYTCAAGDLLCFSKDGNGDKHIQIVPVGLHPAIVAQATAEAGTDTTPRLWTAERVKQAIAALGGGSITLGTPVASTSGTSIDFTSIPAGTKRITINFAGVSTNGTSALMVQIGDSGGVETSGYTGHCSNQGGGSVLTMSGGFTCYTPVVAANTHHGTMVLTLENSSARTWCESAVLGSSSGTNPIAMSAGSKSLSAELDRVRITTVGGTDTFDAGEINITYES